MKNIIKILTVSLSITLPIVSFAQYFTKTQGITGSVQDIIEFMLIPTVFSLALLTFFWGVVKYIRAEGSGAKEDGKRIMIWGVVGLFVMSSVWGLVKFIQTELKITDNASIKIPTIEK